MPAGAQGTAPLSYVAHTLDGNVVKIGVGERPIVVAVFATWCTTCRGEFGLLDSLQRVLAPRQIRVLALSVDAADDAHVRKYIDAQHTSVLVARDASGAVGRTFGTVGVPEAYLIDTKGIVRWHGRGEFRNGIAELSAAVTALK
ncbi:MAG: alkyl hydroperoxide reductase/Thiol specific antioxidant/Mal allergen [Gemmatimonadetes bacterium]|nr:alkyl hydroperoxide reductase/Thiol specific antioxidant/Mal allergen [Gemmatimonadota bacterium]